MRFEVECAFCHKTVKPSVSPEVSEYKQHIRYGDMDVLVTISCPECKRVWYEKKTVMKKDPLIKTYRLFKPTKGYELDKIMGATENMEYEGRYWKKMDR